MNTACPGAPGWPSRRLENQLSTRAYRSHHKKTSSSAVSEGGFHPDNCRLVRKLAGGTGWALAIGPKLPRPSSTVPLSRIAQLDQRTALPDQCLHLAEADVRPTRRKSDTQSGLGRGLELLHCQFGLAAYLAWLAHSDCLALASVTHTGQGVSGGDHQASPCATVRRSSDACAVLIHSLLNQGDHTHLAICREELCGAPRNRALRN